MVKIRGHSAQFYKDSQPTEPRLPDQAWQAHSSEDRRFAHDP